MGYPILLSEVELSQPAIRSSEREFIGQAVE